MKITPEDIKNINKEVIYLRSNMNDENCESFFRLQAIKFMMSLCNVVKYCSDYRIYVFKNKPFDECEICKNKECKINK